MPAKSQQQAKLIYAKRNQYGSKAEAPEKWKWVFDKEWTDDLEMKKLPKKVENEETMVRSMIREILFEEIDLEKGFSDEPEEEDYEMDMLKHGSAMQIQEKNMKLKKLLENTDIFNDDKSQKITEEQRSQVMEFIKNFNSNNETVYREANLSKFAKKLEIVGKIAEQILVNESEDWFDTVSLKRDCKGLSEAIKVFSQTANEVSALQQRLESAYEDVGTKLGKYFEIAGLEDQDPAQERDDLTEDFTYSKDGYVKKITDNSGKLMKDFTAKGKKYRYNSVYKTYNSVKGNELLHKNDLNEQVLTENDMHNAFKNIVKKNLDYITNANGAEFVIIGQNLSNAIKKAGYKHDIPKGQGNLYFDINQ